MGTTVPKEGTEMSELGDKQRRFAVLFAQLILRARAIGYEVTLGETWRHPGWAAEMRKRGKGIANSLHCLKLAGDLNLFWQGVYLTDSEDYRPLGEIWKSWGGAWGGDFLDDEGKPKPDGNHFSLEHEGVR